MKQLSMKVRWSNTGRVSVRHISCLKVTCGCYCDYIIKTKVVKYKQDKCELESELKQEKKKISLKY
jgi:hypothetical protein